VIFEGTQHSKRQQIHQSYDTFANVEFTYIAPQAKYTASVAPCVTGPRLQLKPALIDFGLQPYSHM